MRQLSGVDATFLHMENARTYGHTNSVIILDPSTADQPINADTIRDYIAERIHLLDPLRWRLVEVPLGIDRPYWVDDPDLDLNFHVRGIALPAPGNDRQLANQVARLAARHLDRVHVVVDAPEGLPRDASDLLVDGAHPVGRRLLGGDVEEGLGQRLA